MTHRSVVQDKEIDSCIIWIQNGTPQFENDLLIFARNIARSELLAISHKARIDWLSGRALAPEITFQQLQWYSPEATLG